MDFSIRSTLPELMDDSDLDPAIYQRCLRDLDRLNRITFTHTAALRWIDLVTKNLEKVSILDVAYGHGDLLRAIAGRLERRGIKARLCGIDLNPRSAVAARAATPLAQKIEFLTGDVFAYQPAQKFDFIISSQFTHHLTEAEIIRLLRWCEDHAASGWYITDLHRHALPYYGFRWLARLMFWHRIVRHDGTVSIARSFRRNEWETMLATAGIVAKISWHFPFRYSISRLKS
jgi:2-polyprenyl-3-methyl-5-hydroxy-6-metoxy-1,4-benzoquinol methylase